MCDLLDFNRTICNLSTGSGLKKNRKFLTDPYVII